MPTMGFNPGSCSEILYVIKGERKFQRGLGGAVTNQAGWKAFLPFPYHDWLEAVTAGRRLHYPR